MVTVEPTQVVLGGNSRAVFTASVKNNSKTTINIGKK